MKSNSILLPELDNTHKVSLVFLLFGIFELPPLPNVNAEAQPPLVDSRLWYHWQQTPYEGMGPIGCASWFIAYPSQSRTGVSVCWWHKEGRFPDGCHLRCHVQRHLCAGGQTHTQGDSKSCHNYHHNWMKWSSLTRNKRIQNTTTQRL